MLGFGPRSGEAFSFEHNESMVDRIVEENRFGMGTWVGVRISCKMPSDDQPALICLHLPSTSSTCVSEEFARQAASRGQREAAAGNLTSWSR